MSVAPEPDTPVDPPRVHTARALRDITVPRTPERVARGKYLSEGLLQCFRCHSERDWTKPGAPPIAALKGAGAVLPDRPGLVAPNLTPDQETGIGRWTDDMLLRAIREGIGHEGGCSVADVVRTRSAASRMRMPRQSSRTCDRCRRSGTRCRARRSRPTPSEGLKVPEPITAPVTLAAAADPVQRGRRLAVLADCGGCHTSWYTPRNPGWLAGGNLIERGTLKAYSANLTFAASGLPHYDEALFREVMRTGRMKGRELSPLMPWIVFRNLSDDDLNALFAYLRALPPVKHVIDNVAAPTKCEICGGEHPLGQYNRTAPAKLQEFALSSMRDTVGTLSLRGWLRTPGRDRRWPALAPLRRRR